MANIRHPNFLLGLLAIILAAVALGFRSNKYEFDYYVAIAAAAVGVIHWIWSIIDVWKTDTMQGSQKIFWQIAVTAIPLGGMFYYMLHSKQDTIVD